MTVGMCRLRVIVRWSHACDQGCVRYGLFAALSLRASHTCPVPTNNEHAGGILSESHCRGCLPPMGAFVTKSAMLAEDASCKTQGNVLVRREAYEPSGSHSCLLAEKTGSQRTLGVLPRSFMHVMHVRLTRRLARRYPPARHRPPAHLPPPPAPKTLRHHPSQNWSPSQTCRQHPCGLPFASGGAAAHRPTLHRARMALPH
mmetsp:Transcript_760/g.1563  ORF Transcript_760/g.1563 Transcript_760/m.1563 type:complete len:201 (-) Transcript_760:588-1190(-)